MSASLSARVWNRQNDGTTSTMSAAGYIITVCLYVASFALMAAIGAAGSHFFNYSANVNLVLFGAVALMCLIAITVVQHAIRVFAVVVLPFTMGILFETLSTTYYPGRPELSFVNVFIMIAFSTAALGILAWGSPRLVFGGRDPLTPAIVGMVFSGIAFGVLIPVLGLAGLPVHAERAASELILGLLAPALVAKNIHRAMSIPYTEDNALDAAATVYTDNIVPNIVFRPVRAFVNFI